MRLAFVASLIPLLACCPGGGGGGNVTRPGGPAKVEDLVKQLNAKHTALHSFSGGSTMDYWLGKDRVKGEVLVMGTPGAKVRFAALSPAGGDTIADMTCDGSNFAFVDKQRNCEMAGPCDATSIATFLRVELQPEDFVALALGNPPVPAGATGSVTWDGKRGADVLELSGNGFKETIVIDERDGHFDVVEVKKVGADGKVIWSVENRDFKELSDAAGVKHRVPMKSKLVSPAQGADLLVEWAEDRQLNPTTIPPGAFQLQLPGVAICGKP
jgi:hypothetical protein